MEELNFLEVIKNLKKELNIKADTELAQKFGFSKANFADRKKRNSIPYEEIIKICKINKININKIINNQENINYKEKLYKIIDKLNEKELEYYYHIIKAEIIKKEI